MNAQEFITSFTAACQSVTEAKAARAEVIRKGLLWIASSKATALTDLDAYCENHGVKRFAMVKALAPILMAENFHLADSGKGGAMRLAAIRNLDAEKDVDKETSFTALPLPDVESCKLIVSFKGRVKLETPARVYSWEETKAEIAAMLEKRGFADKAELIANI